jgi:lipoprotein-anchoring transpeptidase ErfK/SrfK
MSQQMTHNGMPGFARVLIAATAAVIAVMGLLGTAPAKASPDIVSFQQDYPLGAIVVVNKERRLYYVIGKGKALRYPVAVGTPENQWTGQLFVASHAVNPSWTPPNNPGRTVPGGPGNPLGVRALYLGWTNYRIHGTNAPGSIGSAASHGCFRMLNQDVTHLYSRVNIGAPVYVVNALGITATTEVVVVSKAKARTKLAKR